MSLVPRLSVVVPVYNVERYLAACLDSLVAQTLRELDIVVVDDGSPDGSAAIAAEYAARDSRIRLVRQDNAGLGAARNAGVAAADPRTEYLAFVDSDDTVPPDAYRTMVDSLDVTGSDFATGNVHHVNSAKTWQVPLLSMLGKQTRPATHIREFPGLVADRIACNKVFRRSFFSEHGLVFPEGVLHEDIPVVVPAHYLARAVDVIADVTYYWRTRDAGAEASITQRRTVPKAVRDRVAAVQHVSDFLASRPEPEYAAHKRAYDARTLKDDLKIFLDVFPEGDDEFRTTFMTAVNSFLDTIDEELVLALPIALRVKWLLVRARRTQELVAQIAAERSREPLEMKGLVRKYAAPAALRDSDLKLPKKSLRFDRELNLKTPLRDARWEAGKLVLSGDAWIHRMDAPNRFSTVKVLQLRRTGSRRRIVIPLRNRYSPLCTTDSGQALHNYDWAGWQFVLDPERLRGRGGRWEESTWSVGMFVMTGAQRRKLGVQASGASRAHYPPYRWLDDEFRLRPFITKNQLKLRVERIQAVVLAHHPDPSTDGVTVEGDIRTVLTDDEAASAVLRVRSSDTDHVLNLPLDVSARDERGRRSFRITAPLSSFAGEAPSCSWSTDIVVSDGPGAEERRFGAVMADGLCDASYSLNTPGADGPATEIAVIAGHTGYLKFRHRPVHALLTELEEGDSGFRMVLTTGARTSNPSLVVCANGRFEERLVPMRRVGGPVGGRTTFEAVFDPARTGREGDKPLPVGRWDFRLRDDGHPDDVPVCLDRLLSETLPHHTVRRGRRYWMEARRFDQVQLNCRSELSDLERGPYRQLELRTSVYRRLHRTAPLRDQVFYFSYNGKQYSDSPRAMHEELLRRGTHLRHLWAVRDGQVSLPAGTEPVPMWSRAWFEALATSRYIVTNGHLPEWIERRPGQVVVQTWHGTMLKKIGHDIETLHFDKEYQNRLRLEAQQWSLLVSSNRFSTPILKRAFSFDGEIVETGYPRNDYLYRSDIEAFAKEVREKIGIPHGKKVVLYAPTWRDDLKHGAGRFKFDMQLDVEAARDALGSDHVLLVRRHSNIVDRVPGADNGFVFDVSDYPDIADLYAACDILVTDYSSVMFDFAHTRRPMLFFTYDLEHYRDTLRGFYFDFEKNAPGPLLRTSEQVIDAVRSIDTVRTDHRDRYRTFLETFCDLDDGRASARVVDRMLEIGTA
ncbi:CDP-glycerol glycerophosphotransferase family protein [Streptomyces longispororuber]|uniref:CDP-glycerol glycerophosphotransferase family protein n=1 Tax=Streptomyces longispororuber TaxID=68230 RepID=UPI00210AD1E3|nr:bifunctional glycosyltransferase/CDP-glycerol:glycerophosphate glycerophosphotransferase [Streptomyces longispororuber]MCQ4210558.1 CDP-glycerol glycerophosphotransferase family protein [Streptomyces longispororuber]